MNSEDVKLNVISKPPDSLDNEDGKEPYIIQTYSSVGSEFGFGPRHQVSLLHINESLSTSEEYTSSKVDKGQCNLCGFTSPCLTMFSGPVWYLVWFSLILFFQSMVVNGFINSSIATLEKRYKLSSKESSLIASMYDIGCMVVVLPVSYYGNKGHKPLWVGFGALIMGIGCFIYASPQFLAGKYEYTETASKGIIMCSNSTLISTNCNKNSLISHLQNFKYLFYLGQFCMGVGASPLFTLGVAYIEEVNAKKSSSLHVGISTAVTAIGPAVGYITLGMLLKIYVDINVPSPFLTPDETEIWVGAWWIGFLIAGFFLLIASIPLIMFPTIVRETVSNMSNKSLHGNIPSRDFYDITYILKNILLNLTYMCVSIASTLTMLSLSGISTYGPKYFESVFDITSSTATITVGVVSVPTLATGALVGGILLGKFNWGLHGSLMFMALSTLISIPLTAGFILRCGDLKMAGVNTPYPGMSKSEGLQLNVPCNSFCNCSSSQNNFHPSCGPDSITYFSPCFAGCIATNTSDNVTTFSNCNCINISDSSQQLIYSGCYMNVCRNYYIVMCILGLMLFCTYLRGAPSVTATMRSVRRSEITVALGFQSIMSRILGSIPGPILFGAVIDKTCILWANKCNEIGNCIKYNVDIFSKSFFLMMFLIFCLNAVCFIVPRAILTSNCKKLKKKT